MKTSSCKCHKNKGRKEMKEIELMIGHYSNHIDYYCSIDKAYFNLQVLIFRPAVLMRSSSAFTFDNGFPYLQCTFFCEDYNL